MRASEVVVLMMLILYTSYVPGASRNVCGLTAGSFGLVGRKERDAREQRAFPVS